MKMKVVGSREYYSWSSSGIFIVRRDCSKAFKIPLCTFLGPKLVRTSWLLFGFTSPLPTTYQILPVSQVAKFIMRSSLCSFGFSSREMLCVTPLPFFNIVVQSRV